MNYSSIQSQVTTALSSLGQTVKVQHGAGGSSLAKGVWGAIDANDLDPTAAAMVTISTRTIYISVTKKEPLPGDVLVVDGVEYGINDVTKYAPAKVVIAYKLGVDY